MSDYIPTAQWLASMPVPDNGNAPTAATFRASLKNIYDRLQWLYEGNAPEQALTAMFMGGSRAADPTHWRWDSTQMAMEQIDAPDSSPSPSPQRFYDRPIRVPHGCRIASIALAVKATAHGALPENLPQLNLRSVTALGVISNHGGQTDTSVDTTAYGQIHTITRNWSVPDVLVDRSTADYIIRIRGESGANSQTGLQVFGAAVTIVTSKYDGAAA